VHEHGFAQIDKPNIYTAAYITALYLVENVVKDLAQEKVLLLGELGFKKELENAGIQVVHLDCTEEDFTEEECANFVCDPSIKAVVAGLDFKYNYRKMCIASMYIQSGCEFICSNKDRNVGKGDRLMPAGGTIVHTIEVASQTVAKVLGKPSKYGFDLMCR